MDKKNSQSRDSIVFNQPEFIPGQPSDTNQLIPQQAGLQQSGMSRRSKHSSAVSVLDRSDAPNEEPSSAPSSNSRLKEIQQQKQKLREKLNQLSQPNSVSYVPSSATEDNISRLMKYKQKVMDALSQMEEEQKASEAAIASLEAQARQKALARKKLEMERLARERVELEGDIRNRQTVLNTIDVYVKGLDSKQLLDKAMQRNIIDSVQSNYKQLPAGEVGYGVKNYISNQDEYQRIVQEMESRAHQSDAKPSIAQLNERRMQIFTQQERLLRKKILLKEMEAQDPDSWQKLTTMSEQQLDELLEKLGHDIDDYRNPLPRQLVLDQLDSMQERAKERIAKLQKPAPTQFVDPTPAIQKCKQQLSRMDPESIAFVRMLIGEMVDAGCDHYDRLLSRLDRVPGQRQAEEANYQLFKKKEALQADLSICTQIAEEMLERVKTQTEKEAADEMFRLHQLAWSKTISLLAYCLNQKDESKLLELMSEHNQAELRYSGSKAPIKFKNRDRENQPQNAAAARGAQVPDVYDAMRDTRELIGDVETLELEDDYYNNVNIVVKKVQTKLKHIKQLVYESVLYAVTDKGVFLIDGKMAFEFPEQATYLASCSNNHMLLYNPLVVMVFNHLGPLELFDNHIGDRVGIEAGEISCCSLSPVTTLIGSVCSFFIGFKSGVLMKFNINRNPVTNEQSNLAFYEPLLPNIRTGEEPNLPNQFASLLSIQSEKLTPDKQLHEYREFFKSQHKVSIVAVVFFRPTQFVTVDENLNFAQWDYNESSGSTYQPVKRFNIKLEMQGYRYPDKPIVKAVELVKSREAYYEQLLLREEGLKRQIYVNPKQSEAIYKRENDEAEGKEALLWRIVFDLEEQRVDKIYEEAYVRKQIKSKAKNARMWNGNLFVHTERQHLIKEDLMTLRVVGWHIATRRLRPISYEIDIYPNEKISNFDIVDSIVPGMGLPGIILISAGRVLVFSMITGQLVKIVIDPNSPIQGFNDVVFSCACPSPTGLAYASNGKQVYHIELEDTNEETERHRYRKEFEKTAIKYLL